MSIHQAPRGKAPCVCIYLMPTAFLKHKKHGANQNSYHAISPLGSRVRRGPFEMSFSCLSRFLSWAPWPIQMTSVALVWVHLLHSQHHILTYLSIIRMTTPISSRLSTLIALLLGPRFPFSQLKDEVPCNSSKRRLSTVAYTWLKLPLQCGISLCLVQEAKLFYRFIAYPVWNPGSHYYSWKIWAPELNKNRWAKYFP